MTRSGDDATEKAQIFLGLSSWKFVGFFSGAVIMDDETTFELTQGRAYIQSIKD